MVKPAHVQQAIFAEDRDALSAMGRKGASIRIRNRNELHAKKEAARISQLQREEKEAELDPSFARRDDLLPEDA